MFGKLFGKKKAKGKKSKLPEAPDKPETAPPTFLIEGARLLDLVLPAISRDEKRIHVETVLTLLSGLAGFSAQMAIREKFIKIGRQTEDDLFRFVKTKNGDTYYLSLSYAEPLFNLRKKRPCVYKTVMEAAHETGGNEFPGDASFMLLDEHVKSSFGKGSFGVPRLPAEHMPRHPPVDMLRDSWDTVAVCLKLLDGGEPLHWPYIAGEALRHLILKSRGAVDPNLITPLFLETAMPMSHVNPLLIVGQSGRGGALTVDFSRTEEGRMMQDEVFKKSLEQARAEPKDEKKVIH